MAQPTDTAPPPIGEYFQILQSAFMGTISIMNCRETTRGSKAGPLTQPGTGRALYPTRLRRRLACWPVQLFCQKLKQRFAPLA